MQNQITLPVSQMAMWLDRYWGNVMSDQIRREIDSEILCTLAANSNIQVPETPDWQLWLTDEQLEWCKHTSTKFTVSLEYAPKNITFIFESAEHAVQFATTWL